MGNKNEIVPSFQKSLFNDDIGDAIKDFAEISIDSIMEDGVIKNIPIVQLLLGVGKAGLNIRDRIIVKQTLVFLKEFKSGKISEEKYNEHKEQLSNDPKFADKELSVVIAFLSDIYEEKSSKIAARMYLSYINRDLCWEKFKELLEVNRRLFLDDLIALQSLSNDYYRSEEFYHVHPIEDYRFSRLVALGLVIGFDSPTERKRELERALHRRDVRAPYSFSPYKKENQITELGELFLRYID